MQMNRGMNLLRIIERRNISFEVNKFYGGHLTLTQNDEALAIGGA
jgi:hypothetical protein